VKLLFNDDGKLRAFWRVLVFFWIGTGLSWVEADLINVVTNHYPALNQLSIQAIIFFEGMTLVNALVCTWVFARYEKRRIDSYGLPIREAFSARLWEGLALGAVVPALVGLGMLALHGWVIVGFNLHGGEWFVLPLGWLVANIFVGIAEETWYRGYMLQTLSKSLGFWPAAVILSLLFVSDHYFFKTGENLYDVVTLFFFGIFICLSVRRTGTLWFGVGFHIAFDFMQLFVIGTRNGALTPVGSLFVSHFPGPAWINGGALGTEASVLVYPATILMFTYLLWRYPRNQALSDPPEDINFIARKDSP
jgi:membrane protease YdiL (CAAX protease family)